MTLQEELQHVLNKHNAEGGCANTPDFILAKYLTDCLQAYARAVAHRERWYGFEMHPGMGDIAHRVTDGQSGESGDVSS